MVKLTVITREVSPAIEKCELTCLDRQPISYEKVVAQHHGYVGVFEKLLTEGYDLELIRLPAMKSYPDSMFMEDVACIYDDCAIITRPGAPSRRGEAAYITPLMKYLRPGNTFTLEAPAHTDGGDIFPVGRYIFVGESTRTNDDAFEQMKKIMSRYSYVGEDGKHMPFECVRLPVKGRLHTKTAGSFLTDKAIMMDTTACDASIFTSRGIEVLASPEGETDASNPLSFVVEALDGSRRKRVVVINAGFPKTAAMIHDFAQRECAEGRLTEVIELQMDEVAKAEGSLTCLSLLCYHTKKENSEN